jgi:sarcosine oxidase, subunit delta
MLRITCPHCGQRPEIEFRYAGEAHIVRDTDAANISDADWQAFLYLRSNTLGLHRERWRHTHGCGQFFNAIRDTKTDKFVATYAVGAPIPELES